MAGPGRPTRIDIRYERPEYSARPQKGLVAIYALCCPQTEEPRYVGKASDAVRRYCQHISCPHSPDRTNYHDNWIAALIREGLRPILYIVDNVPKAEWGAAERHYIAVFREMGARLTNANDGGGADSGPPLSRRKADLSDERRAAIGQRLNECKRGELYRLKRGIAESYRWLLRRDSQAAGGIAARMRDLQRSRPDLFPAKWANIGLDVAA